MKFVTYAAKAGLACLLASTALSAAQAQMIGNRVVVFGDSLSDNGNLYAVSGEPPLPYNKRFTNGLTWVEYLAGPMATSGAFTLVGGAPLDAGNLDFAFGGSRTDSLATPGPGIKTQIDGFAAYGGSFGANDIVTLWGGANDIFQGIAIAVGTPSTAAATMTTISTTAGNNIGAEVQELIGLGAKKIIVNSLPDFSALPSFAGTPAQQLAYLSSSTFNTVLNANLMAIAAANPNVNIISIDVAKAFNAVIADPRLFGITNTTDACITVLTCVGGSVAAQNAYLFWDSVHPTQTGHMIIANVVNATLLAGTSAASAQAFTDIGYQGRRNAMLGAFEQLAAIPKTGDKPEFFISVIGARQNQDAANGHAAFSSTAAGLRLGGIKSINESWRFGLALSAVTGGAKAGDIKFNPTQFDADVLLGWTGGNSFVNFGLGAGVNSFGEYQRNLVGLPWANSASVGGTTASAAVEGGVHLPYGALELTPQVRLAYLYSSVGGFGEIGNAATVSVNNRSVSGLTGAVELKAAFKISETVKASAMIGYEGLVTGSSSALSAQLIGNPALPTITATKAPSGAGATLGLGLMAQLSPGVMLNASYRGALMHKGSSHMLNFGVNAKF